MRAWLHFLGGGIGAAVIDADDFEIAADRRISLERRRDFLDQRPHVAGFVQQRNDDGEGGGFGTRGPLTKG